MRLSTIVFSVVVAILFCAGRAAAQDEPITCADWMAVQSWFWNGYVQRFRQWL